MRLSPIIRIINVVLLLIFSVAVAFSQRTWTIVLDAGHGGKDPGTVNGRNYEKTINLAVVLATGEILSKRPDVKIVYTRKTDIFVKVAERSNIASRAKADLFVSIHTNASPNKKASGTETYIMGVDKSNANLGVAMRENGVISLESDYSTTYEGYDPQSAESLIMFSLMQYSFSRESLELAALFQKNFAQLGRKNNGVRQDGFLVLWRNAMPSVLTELGYLSNADEMQYLLSTQGQKALSKSIASAVVAYIDATANDVSPSTVKTATKSTEKSESDNDDQLSTPTISATDAHYAVQVRSTKESIEINSRNFGPLVMQIRERKTEKNYKYTVGELFFYKEALLLQDKIRKHFPDAFIVAFDQNGVQMAVGQARKIIENN